jgi:dihydroorotate dehydrogenase
MSLYESIVRPMLFKLPPETAHELGLGLLRLGLGAPPARFAVKKVLQSEGFGELERFGLKFPNPLGVAAGFDKNGRVVDHLASLGFGFVEVGTVTLEPQSGNPKPRIFRLPQDKALINRLGFNNEGAKAIAERLSSRTHGCVLGVNIGRNRDVPNEDAVGNYIETFRLVQPVADYVTVNVSSPNTPGLRDLQTGESLDTLLSELSKCNDGFEAPKPILLKIAPDLSEDQVGEVVEAALRNGVAGIVATNTTIGREGLRTPEEELKKIGPGGLSGMPLANKSCSIIRKVYRLSEGKLPIIGVGGIFTAEDAFAKVAAGASLLQSYTGFVYGGPWFARRVNSGLAKILKDRGFNSLDEAVGTKAEKKKAAP